MKKVLLLFFTIVLFASGILFANGNSSDLLNFSPDNDITGYDVIQSTTTITTFPWTEGFESGALPTDWTQVYVSGTVSWTYQSGGYSSNPSGAHSGNYNTYLFYSSSTRNKTMLITPDLDLSSLFNPQITFWHAQAAWSSDQDILRVYYRPASDPNWVLLASYTSSITTWTEETISLASIPLTEPIYIAFEGDAAYGYGVVLDDITVDAGPTCPKPTALAASNLLTTSADLSWTAGSSETTWDIEYKLATDATWTLVSGVTTNPYPLTGLTTFSLYNWRVKAICGASDESDWSDISSFRTPCEAVSIFPVTEGFENASFPPDCWTVAHTQGSDTRTWISGTSYYHTGYTSAQLQDQYSGNKNNLVTPLLDIPTAAGYQVTFWVYRNTTGTGCPNEGVKVWANSNPDTVGGTPLMYIRRSIDIAPTEAAMGWYEYSATIPDAGLQYIIFEGISDYCTSTYMDDITIGERPTCPKPENLQVSNITTTSVDLSWTEIGTATMWNIEYGTVGFVPGTGTVISGATNPYPLTGLLPATGYEFFVQADCGGSDLSLWSTRKSFRTACDDITLLPYTENFDTYGTNYGTFPDCWNRPIINGSYPGVNTTYFMSAPVSLMFNSLPTTPTYAISPAIDVDISTLQVSFWLKAESTTSSGIFQVGVMSSDSDLNTFDTVLTIVPTNTDWTYYEVILNTSQYSGAGNYVAFSQSNSNYWYYFLDDVLIDVIPTCPKPDSVLASNVTTTSFDVSWVERGTATSWNIEYGTSGFTQGTGTLVYGVTNPYPITGLDPSTAYDVYVQSDCGGSDLSYWTYRKTFRTLCDNVSAVPYIENFDSYGTASGVFPDCWSRPVSYNNYGTIYPSIDLYTYHSSTGSVKFNSLMSTPTYALTPAFDISIDSLQVSFWLKAEDPFYSGTFQIGVMSNDTDITTFDTIVTVMPTTSDWTYYEIALNASQYIGNGYYIAFKQISNSDYYYFFLDDVMVDYIPDCIRPDNIVFSNATPNSVDVVWNERGSANSWNIEYGPAGFVQGNGTLTLGVTNPYTIPNLTPSTLYDFYVQSDCGNGSSYWTEVETFTTTQIPFVAPGTIDFEDTLENSNWSFVNGTATNKWYIGAGANNTVGGTNGLYISDNYGVSNSYNNTSLTYVWAYRDIQFTPTTGEYQLKFDWRAQGESSYYDYIQIYIGDPAVVSSGSSVPPAGVTQIGTVFNLQSTWKTDSLILSSAYSNTTKRLYFMWYSDYSGGSNPPGAIDNIVITDIPCATISNLDVSGITTNSANVIWNPANAESAWDIVYDTAGFDPSLGTIIALTDTTYAISGLLPNTNYDVYVRANCGTTTGNWVLVNFSTECIAFTTLPFIEGFETTSQSLNCWRVVDGNNDGESWGIYTGSGHEHSGTQFAGMNTDGNGGMNNDYLITPNILLTGNQFLSFYHRIYSTYEPNDYRVLLSTTGSDPADFTTVLFSDTSTLTTYDEVVLDLSAYSGNVYIAFHIPQGGLDGWYLFIDDVTVDTWPTCPSPIALTVSNVSTNSASLAWTSRGTETAWEVQYKLITDATWTVVQANTNPYPLTGLIDASRYEVKVRAVCGPADSSYFSPIVNFNTTCLPLALPYSENFDSYTGTTYSTAGVIPICWYSYSDNTSYPAPHIIAAGGSYAYVNSAPNALVFTAGGSGSNTYAVLPEFNVPINTMTMTFYTRVEYSSNGVLYVGYVENSQSDITSFTAVDTIPSTETIIQYTVSFANAPATAKNIAFYWTYNSSYYSCCIDDIQVTGATGPQDTCDNPISLAIPSATLACDSAIVNWAAGGSETMWTFEYKRNADPDFTSVVVTTPAFTMTGLLQLTQYNVRVKALCGTGDESDYTTASFTTPQCGVTSYIITASATSGGAISPSGEISVVAGGNQAFTMTPDDTTYYLHSLVVDGVVTTAQTVYSFNGVNANHTIHAVFAPVGINENNLQNSVVIFPNPANDLLNVKLSQEFESVEITNMLGQLLYSNRVNDSFLQINISSYTSGVYFIRLKGENGLATKKFIKE